MPKVNKKVPVIFQTLEEFDSRFLRVKIWIMHTGLNRNRSFFTKEVIENAIPTLANTPILGYILGDDFKEHVHVLTKKDDQYKDVYLGQAYGVIPETNNAKFEMRVCDDGIEREFLTVEGIMWRKWDDAIDLLEETGVKTQSMEIADEPLKGEWINKVFYFSEFAFFGACFLGDSVMPAMIDSTIETNFSYADLQKEVQEKMEEFKQLHSFNYQKKEDDQMAKGASAKNVKKKQKIDEKPMGDGNKAPVAMATIDEPLKNDGATSVDPKVENGLSGTAESATIDSEPLGENKLPEVEVVVEEGFKGSTENPEIDNEPLGGNELPKVMAVDNEPLGDGATVPKPVIEKEAKFDPVAPAQLSPTSNFAVSSTQTVDALRAELRELKAIDRWGYMCQEYFYKDHLPEEKIVIVEDPDESKYVGFPYAMVSGAKAEIDFAKGVVYVVDWTPALINVEDDDLLINTDSDDTNNVPATEMAVGGALANDYLEYALKQQEKRIKGEFAKHDSVSDAVKSEFAAVKQQFSALEEEAVELRKFKADALKDQLEFAKNELLTQFSAKLEETEIKSVLDNEALPIDTMRKELFALVGMKTSAPTSFSSNLNTTPLAKVGRAIIPKGGTNEPSYIGILERNVGRR